jgi:hemerythrin-like domain-containing protein
MKRFLELRDLSEDHHHGLVLAPHFQIEELLIAPGLETVGETMLAKRLYDEHRALRECVRPESGRTPSDLHRFGELQENHVRFEERELFEVAQKCLSSQQLGAIAEACRANRA